MQLNLQPVARFNARLLQKLLPNWTVKRTKGLAKSWLFPLGLRRFERLMFFLHGESKMITSYACEQQGFWIALAFRERSRPSGQLCRK